jgi:hypothetical protein
MPCIEWQLSFSLNMSRVLVHPETGQTHESGLSLSSLLIFRISKHLHNEHEKDIVLAAVFFCVSPSSRDDARMQKCESEK